MATYTCTQCNHVNEAERVYCHNCGAKLDRSLLPQDEKKDKKETPDQARKRVIKLVNPARGIFTMANVRKFIETLAMAAVVATLVQAARTPDNIPPVMPKEKLIDVPQIGDVLDDEVARPKPHPIVVPEEIANGYLQKTIKMKSGGGKENDSYLKFERAFVRFDDGLVAVGIKLTLFDWPLYATSLYKLSANGTELAAENAGGAFGRMPVHPLVMKYADAVFGNLWPALKREKKLLDQMQSVELRKGQIVFTTAPKAAGPRK